MILSITFPPLPDCSVILKTINYLNLTVPSSWGPLPISTWLFHHPGYLYLTVSSPWVSLPSSTWQFRQPGYHYTPIPDSSIILGTTNHLYLADLSSCGPLLSSADCLLHCVLQYNDLKCQDFKLNFRNIYNVNASKWRRNTQYENLIQCEIIRVWKHSTYLVITGNGMV